MEILYLLVPVSVVLVFAIGVAFWWSLKSGQFDDMEGPAYRILMDDDRSSTIGGKTLDDTGGQDAREAGLEASDGHRKKDATV